MEPVDLNELYKKYPILEDIANRLELSQQTADKKNKDKFTRDKEPIPEGEIGHSRPRKKIPTACEHAVIDKFFTNNGWVKTYHPLQAGKDAFETNLQRIVSRKPDAIHVLIVNGQRISSASKPEKITIKLNESAQVTDSADKDPVESEVLNTLKLQLGSLENQIKSNPVIKTDSEGQNNLLQLNFAQQLTDIKHKHEIETITRDHRYEVDKLHSEYQNKIDELEYEIDDLEEYIEDLESERTETETALSGIDTKIKEAENPPIFKALGRVLSNTLENLAKENTDLLSKLGIPEDELKEYFKTKEDNKTNPKQNINNNSASFSEAGSQSLGNPTYNKLDAIKKQVADALIEIIDGSTADDLKILVGSFKYAFNEDATINLEVLGAMFQAGKSKLEESKKQTTETE